MSKRLGTVSANENICKVERIYLRGDQFVVDFAVSARADIDGIWNLYSPEGVLVVSSRDHEMPPMPPGAEWLTIHWRMSVNDRLAGPDATRPRVAFD